MAFKRILYILLVVVVAGLSALGGAAAGGYGVYQAVKNSAGVARAHLSRIASEQHQSSHNADSQRHRYSNRDHSVRSKSWAGGGDSGRNDPGTEHLLRFEPEAKPSAEAASSFPIKATSSPTIM